MVNLTPYELIHCGECGRDQRARPIAGQRVMPCSYCGNEVMEVYDLVPEWRGRARSGSLTAELREASPC